MYFWIINCLTTFLLCVFFAGIVIPQILLIAFRRKLFDVPDERKIHHSAVPRLGGIAFNPVVTFTIALLLGVSLSVGHTEMLDEMVHDIRPLSLAFCSIVLLYMAGIADDLIGIRYRAKFVIQFLCGIMLVAGGLYIDNLHGIFGVYELPLCLAHSLTVLLVVFIINAVNLIDGIDGLASGLASIACLFYGFTFFVMGQYIYALLAFATLGVLVPFFYYNVFGNAERESKIFMGDTGSLTIGMMLCILSIKLLLCDAVHSMSFVNPIVLALSPLLVPCFDVIRVSMYRIRIGKSPFLPDNNHIHHKLLALGMKQRYAMMLIVSVSLAFILFNIFMSIYLNVNLVILVDVMLWVLAIMCLSKRLACKNEAQARNQ